MRTRVQTVRNVALFFSFFFISIQSFSQSVAVANGKVEIGLGLGPSFFLGDLGGTRGIGRTFVKDVNFPFTKLMKGIYINVYPTEWLGFRIAANLGELEAFDSIITNHGGEELERKKRNLDFRSKLSEAYVAAEIYPTVFLEKYDGLLHKLRPYGVCGIGVFHFNPQGIYIAPNGAQSWVYLKPLMLEGQGMSEYPDRKPYSLTQLEIPMGFGLKYYIKENMYIGFEILHRKTFTDYIDDVSKTYIDPSLFDKYLTPSQAVIARQLEYRENIINPSVNRPYINEQRGDPSQNDAFFSGILRFGWRLGGTQDSRIKKQLKCPHFF
ncbi:MAG: hypothetical protein JST17_12830 [Bacteroidetes bacterium]|nr:hypothetical protein [Bacteroidota bacterium]MBS1930530.1 hypothetical protein [Bacteroidota bacterium]